MCQCWGYILQRVISAFEISKAGLLEGNDFKIKMSRLCVTKHFDQRSNVCVNNF